MQRRLFYILYLCITICTAQTSYLDSVASLENRISDKEFLQAVLDIEYDKALTHSKKYLGLAQKAQRIAVASGDKKLMAEAYGALALAYHFSSQFELAIANTLQSADLYRDLDDMENYANSYTTLGWKLKNRDLSKASTYMLKGIKVLEDIDPSSKNLIGAYNNYGVLKQRSSQLDSAFYYHNRSLDLAVVHRDSVGIPFAQSHIAEVYIKRKQFSLAEKVLNEALTLREKRNDIYGITDSQLYLGDLFFAKQEYKTAIFHFKKAQELAARNHYFPLKKYALEYIAKSYEGLKDTENALRYYKEYNTLKDSILNIDTNSKIAELEIQFQTAEKEKEIAQQKLQIKNKNIFAILLGGSLLLIVIVSFGLYKRQQFKRKQLQKELDLKEVLATVKTQNKLQEQRLQISRDLHDNIGSQLTFITSSIDNLTLLSSEMNDTMKEKLTGISDFTIDTIDQLRDTIWAMNKNEISSEELHSRMLSFLDKAREATINIRLTIQNDLSVTRTFSSVTGIHLFRVFQEAINNAVKYAQASSIEVLIEGNMDVFRMKIADNGIGFTSDEVPSGNGLVNMRKRIEEIQGNIQIDSTPGAGTQITITL